MNKLALLSTLAAAASWTSPASAAVHTTVTYDYDGQGNRTSITDSTGAQVTMTYTPQNRIDELRSPEGTTRHAWNHDGTLDHLSQANGTVVQYTYYANKRVQSIEHRVNEAAIVSFSYTYDGNGNRTTETRTDAASPVGPGQVTSTTYGYDDNDRLAYIDDGTLQTTYGVDPAGNRTSERVVDATAQATVSNKTYIVNDHDQVESFSDSVTGVTVEYGYDGSGNRISRTVTTGGSSPVSSTTNYTFDARDRMIAVQPLAPNPDNDLPVSYAYDGDGRRIARTVGSASPTVFVYDGPRLLHEGSIDGTAVNFRTTYRRGARLDHLVVNPGSGTQEVRFYHLDALQTPVVQSNPTGTPLARMSYDAWGNMRPTLSTLLPRPPRTADTAPKPAEAFAALMAWSPMQ